MEMKKNKLDLEIISSISSPNVWTPEKEDEWLKQPARELVKRFPPMNKPLHISFVAKKKSWL